MKKKNATIQSAITWLDIPTEIDNKLWLTGTGNTVPNTVDLFVVLDSPSASEIRNKKLNLYNIKSNLNHQLKTFQVDLKNAYYTYAVKYATKKKPVIKDIKECNTFLHNEISKLSPRYIITLGSTAFEAVMYGSKRKFSDYNGILTDYPLNTNIKVYATYAPGYLIHNPSITDNYNSNWRDISRLQKTGDIEYETTNVYCLNKLQDLQDVIKTILDSKEDVILAIDAEWHGRNWLSPDKYIRTFQFTNTIGVGCVVEFYNEKKEKTFDNEEEAWKLLKSFLTNPKIKLIGHNILSDDEWLLQYGIDIRNNILADTMLNEHFINMEGPFGLEILALKYTNLGRYYLPLFDWKNSSNENKAKCTHGYGYIPRDILVPYAASDVDATLQSFYAQLPLLSNYMDSRGKYPSLLSVDLCTQKTLREMETSGLKVDLYRLRELTDRYQQKLLEFETQLKNIATSFGVQDFNPSSPPQVSEMLFDKLKLTPILTTEGQLWEKAQTQKIIDPEDDEELSASTNKTVLEILQDQHVFVKLLRDTRKLSHTCKTWLSKSIEPSLVNFCTEQTDKAKGILKLIWNDGKIHSRFSQLKETARLSSNKPNCQNWPKKAEGDIQRILGKDIPSIKTIIIPDSDEYIFIEADWSQAELFGLAYLSGDKNMMDALTTPGKDLHDITGIKSFNLKVTHPDGTEVNELELLAIAKRDIKEYKKLQETLLYHTARKQVLTRDEFKSGLRVSAKAINFKVMYGSGPQSIAIQVKAETGTSRTVSDLTFEIKDGIYIWKNNLYPVAWNFLEESNRAAADPGYLVNAWGRIRKFPYTTNKYILSGMGREAQNWKIQSLVSDTCRIAFWLIEQYRLTPQGQKLHFRIVNQIHDAILFMVPKPEKDETIEMIYKTMGNIQIPTKSGDLVLKPEISVMSNWGEEI